MTNLRGRRGRLAAASVATAILLAPGAVRGAAELLETTSSPDITIAVDAGTLTANDEDAIVEDAAPPALTMLGPLPANADLSGYHLLSNGDQLFSLDTAVELPGPLFADPRDVASYDGVGYSIAFDGGAEGVPNGARIDAITAAEDGDVVLSFDITVDLDGLTVDDEDLVRFDPAAGFSVFLDGGAAAVPSALDLDGAHYIQATGNLLVSFDTSGQLGGVDFDDEDVIEHDPAAGTWEPSVSPAAAEPDWIAADLDAFHAVRSCTSLGGDQDGDLLCDDEDPCLVYPNTLPTLDSNGDGIPNECQCGDTAAGGPGTNNGLLQSADAFAIAGCVTAPGSCVLDIGLSDTNNNGLFQSGDAFAVATQVVTASATAFSLTCARRPEGTPP